MFIYGNEREPISHLWEKVQVQCQVCVLHLFETPCTIFKPFTKLPCCFYTAPTLNWLALLRICAEVLAAGAARLLCEVRLGLRCALMAPPQGAVGPIAMSGHFRENIYKKGYVKIVMQQLWEKAMKNIKWENSPSGSAGGALGTEQKLPAA